MTGQESLLKWEDWALVVTELGLTQQLWVEDNHQDKADFHHPDTFPVPTPHLWRPL